MRTVIRPLAVLVASLSLAVVPTGLTRAAAPAPHDTASTFSNFTGDWTPDKTSNTQFVGHHFVVQTTVESPRILVTDPSLQAQFDDFCNPNVAGTPVTYFILSYTWSPVGTMGGCVSPMTKGHVYVWGSHDDVAYVHPSTQDGEDVLSGGWAVEPTSGTLVYKKITAHRPVVNFVIHIKQSEVVAQHSHQYRQTQITGLGELRLDSRPPDGCEAQDWDVDSSDGSIDLEITKVGGPAFLDLYDLTLAVGAPKQKGFQICDNGIGYADAIPVTVTKADPSEQKACPKGRHGTLSIESHTSRGGGDKLELAMPSCKLDIELGQDTQRKGDHIAVVVDLNRNGY